jgi:membrane protease YdiL (CAAX protease family)
MDIENVNMNILDNNIKKDDNVNTNIEIVDNNNTVTAANKFLMIFGIIFVVATVLTSLLVIAYMIIIYLSENYYSRDFYQKALSNFRSIPDWLTYLTYAISQIGVIFIPTYIYLRKKKIKIQETLRFNKIKALPAFLIIIAAAPITITISTLNDLILNLFYDTSKTVSTVQLPEINTVGKFIIATLFIAVMPAIFEELMFRGVFLTAYERRGSYKAIIFSGLFFGLFHFDLSKLFFTIVLGFILAYYVLRTNSIYAGMIGHFTNNFLGILSLLSVNYYRNTLAGLPQNTFTQNIIAIIICASISVFLLSLFKIATNTTANDKKRSISSFEFDLKSIFSHWPIIIFLILYIGLASLTLIGTFVK